MLILFYWFQLCSSLGHQPNRNRLLEIQQTETSPEHFDLFQLTLNASVVKYKIDEIEIPGTFFIIHKARDANSRKSESNSLFSVWNLGMNPSFLSQLNDQMKQFRGVTEKLQTALRCDKCAHTIFWEMKFRGLITLDWVCTLCFPIISAHLIPILHCLFQSVSVPGSSCFNTSL